MSPTYESIFKVLKKFPHPLTAREISANAEHEGTTATYGMALHALSQDGGPLERKRDLETGAFLYTLRDGITPANFTAPPKGPRQSKPAVAEPKAEAPRVAGIAPSKPINTPAPIRATELVPKPPEPPAGVNVRRVNPMDEQPNTTSTSQSSNENPGGLTTASDRSPREDAAKVVTIRKSPKVDRNSVDALETIEARLRTNIEHLISAACMSADPVVRGFGVTVKELKGICDLIRTTTGRDAA